VPAARSRGSARGVVFRGVRKDSQLAVKSVWIRANVHDMFLSHPVGSANTIPAGQKRGAVATKGLDAINGVGWVGTEKG
jgi:hypothetical protein